MFSIIIINNIKDFYSKEGGGDEEKRKEGGQKPFYIFFYLFFLYKTFLKKGSFLSFSPQTPRHPAKNALLALSSFINQIYDRKA